LSFPIKLNFGLELIKKLGWLTSEVMF